MRPLLIVVDADAIVAEVHQDDANHSRALAISQKLKGLGAQLIYPATAIAEAVAVLQHKTDKPELAYGTAANFVNGDVEISEVSPHFPLAIQMFSAASKSKKNTIFDCLVAATAQSYHADAIFSFDKFYKRKGFKLASDL